jgi:hypothetical protein
MHAVSRDTSSFHSPCIYLQVEAKGRFSSATQGSSANGTAAMDTSGSHANGSGGHDSSGATHDDDSEQDGDEDDDEAQEVRLVPLGAEGDSALDAVLDRLYEALSECAALNPDPDDGSDDEDDYELDEGADGLQGVVSLEGLEDASGWIDPQSLLAGATPAQRAMLERYDAMLEASELETRVDTLRVDNSDGRFDDAEEGDEQSMEGGSHHPSTG